VLEDRRGPRDGSRPFLLEMLLDVDPAAQRTVLGALPGVGQVGREDLRLGIEVARALPHLLPRLVGALPAVDDRPDPHVARPRTARLGDADVLDRLLVPGQAERIDVARLGALGLRLERSPRSALRPFDRRIEIPQQSPIAGNLLAHFRREAVAPRRPWLLM